MPLTYQNIVDYSGRVKTVTDQAVDELARRIANIGATEPERRAQFIRMHVRAVAEEYGLQEQELGAQWYEFCARAAGVNVETAIVNDIDYERLDNYFQSVLEEYENGERDWSETEQRIFSAFESQMRALERETIIDNLERDASESRRWRQTRRAAMKAGYARVPVGETCAWCLMLASLGYFYRSEKTALYRDGIEPDRYHEHCDCIAVPYNEPGAIEGYDDYELYFNMYADARDAFYGRDYSDETARRIEEAREKHDRDYAMGKTDVKWADTNAILMIMREQQGMEH